MKKLLVILPMLMILFAGNLLTSCVDPEPPRAVITVYTVDQNDVQWPVPNCNVTVILPSGSEGDASQPDLLEYADKAKLTDINGQVEYEFKYEGIIQIEARKGSGAESCGRGVIILKEDEVYEERIRLSICN